jgi:hypothetical protein
MDMLMLIIVVGGAVLSGLISVLARFFPLHLRLVILIAMCMRVVRSVCMVSVESLLYLVVVVVLAVFYVWLSKKTANY